MIHDAKITPLKILSDERGKVMHMLRNDSDIFKQFGEIYFSTIYNKAIKGWHLHKESYLNYTCIKGEVKLVLYDDRKGSSSKNKYQEIILSPKNYFLITIPPNIWNGFKGISKERSIIANCLTLPHNEKEMVRKDKDDKFLVMSGNNKLKNIKIVILCGGVGSRLAEETKLIPKPMVKIGKMPIISHIMKIYEYYGFKNFLLATGYKSKILENYFKHKKMLDVYLLAIKL